MMQQNKNSYNHPPLLDRQQTYADVPFYAPWERTRPRRLDIFLHAIKTFRLIGSLLTDPRISLFRKLLFFASIAALLLILLFPDVLNEFVMSTILPLAGTILGVPIDASFDWVAFAMVIVSLLRFFPPELVAEHYRQIFRI